MYNRTRLRSLWNTYTRNSITLIRGTSRGMAATLCAIYFIADERKTPGEMLKNPGH